MNFSHGIYWIICESGIVYPPSDYVGRTTWGAGERLFYGAPYHDVPALIAFLTILITTVNFVVSVEVNFYPKYRNYYSLFNDKGAIKDIMQAGNEMREVLNMELKYTAVKQLLTTALAISIGGFY